MSIWTPALTARLPQWPRLQIGYISHCTAVNSSSHDVNFQLNDILFEDDSMVLQGANGVFVKALTDAAGEEAGGRKRRSTQATGLVAETQIAFVSGDVNATLIDEAFSSSNKSQNVSSEGAQSIA